MIGEGEKGGSREGAREWGEREERGGREGGGQGVRAGGKEGGSGRRNLHANLKKS